MNRILLWIAALVGVAAPLCVVFAAMAVDIGWVSLETGIGTLVLGLGWWLAIAGLGLAVAAALLNLKVLGRALAFLAIAFVGAGLTVGGLVWAKGKADALPPVHETATDWSDPLVFSQTILSQRGPGDWPVEEDPVISGAIADARPAWAPWAGRRVAEVNAEACPGASTIPRLVPQEEVIAALEAEGVRVLGESPWRVEGTQESPWFGRQRDVVVRMEPEATDIRVSERSGLIDLGQTCDLAASLVRRLTT